MATRRIEHGALAASIGGVYGGGTHRAYTQRAAAYTYRAMRQRLRALAYTAAATRLYRRAHIKRATLPSYLPQQLQTLAMPLRLQLYHGAICKYQARHKQQHARVRSWLLRAARCWRE